MYTSFSYGLLKRKGARSADFLVYSALSYRFLKKKGARSAENFSDLKYVSQFFSRIATKVCVGKMQTPATEKFV